MDKVKDIFNKYKIIITIFLLLLASFFVYLFVFADEDIYENQIEVKNTRISITDGTVNADGNMDSNDEAGNDSSVSNKIVRNFDKVVYEISYDLGYKEDSTLEESEKSLSITRDVIVDILVPSNIGMNVSESADINVLEPEKDRNNNIIEITDNDITYRYYRIDINDIDVTDRNIGANQIDIILSNINGSNGDKIRPIIRVREKTDNVSAKEITSETNLSDITGISIEDVTISANSSYGVKLYPGTKKGEDNTNSEFPIGILIYLPQTQNKGIRGIEVPKTVSFDVTVNSDSTSEQSSILEGTKIINYQNDNDYTVADFPYSYTNNGNAAISSETLNNNGSSIFSIRYTGLNFSNDTSQINISDLGQLYYLSAKILVFKNQRSSTYKNDINYNVSISSPNMDNIDLLDNYEPFVGDYISKIDFVKSYTSYDGVEDIYESGKAIYNYSEDVLIRNTISYGYTKGDKLENGFTNYVKIDNTAFKLVNTENVSDQSLDYFVEYSRNNNYEAAATYGLGDWNLNYFRRKSTAPSYCPSNAQLSAMNETTLRETLMNLYGGPCIEATNVEWVSTIQDAIDSNKANKIIIFKFDMLSEYDTGTTTTIRLTAKAVKNYSNIGKTFAITSRGETTDNNKAYYLSEIANKSVDKHVSDIAYTKTQYDVNHNIIGGNVTTANVNGTSTNITNIGNTALISAFKASINPIELHDAYNSVGKTTFYAGMTDPIEFIINPVIYKSDFQSTITGATVSVYLPESLEIYVKPGDKQYNTSTSGATVNIDGVNYKEYKYDYSESDINFENESVSGTIPNLYVHAYIKISTPDRTNARVISRISGTLKPNSDATTVYGDVTSIDQRTTSVDIQLRNTRDINSIGTTNVNYIDQNGTYTYNMRSANSSSSSAEISLLYILPYSGDGIGKGSKFTGTVGVSIANNSLPTGYKAYYTTDNVKTILSNELATTSTTTWKEWTNPSTTLNNATAIRITSPSAISSGSYFANPSGITFNITTNGNQESEKYYNMFYMIQKNADVCINDDILVDCTQTEKGTTSFSSNISQVSVYNRKISGYAFEDTNYSGFYDNNEARLRDIPVDLYKLSATTFDAKNPVASISDSDQLMQETTIDRNGYYNFDGLSTGNYYVKYTFDCDKYTVTEKNKVDINNEGDATLRDSDANMVEYTSTSEESIEDNEESKTENSTQCYAVSNIMSLNNTNVEFKHIDLGLRIRQDFDIKMSKYITNVKVTSNKGVQNYDYKNETKVVVPVKNLKNTSFRVTYGIEIENSKYFPGTIGNIVETIPEGMTFDPSLPENDGWVESDGNLYYAYLNKVLIMPGEKYHLTIVLDLVTSNGGDYINFVAANNLQIKPVITNFLEIPEAAQIEDEDEEADE